MLTVDTQALTQVITTCFNLAMDGRLNRDQQKSFLVAGKRLRGTLVNLISAQFNDGTPEVLAANQQLVQVNLQVAQAVNNFGTLATVLDQINILVGGLDELLKLASSFH